MTEVEEHIIVNQRDLATCCEHLAASRRFGLDTEFVGEDSYHPHLCLVQVATAERLFLIDPLTIGPLDEFWNLVTDPENQVIVHAGREEIRLCQLWTGRCPGNLFDLQLAAGLVGLPYPLGHGTLVQQLLGIQLAKAETLTEWRDRPLSDAQVRYALDDVRYLMPLWEKISTRLEELDRVQWAHEEFARLSAIAAPGERTGGAPERWRRLKGTGALDRRRLAVLRELYQWREETAARTNRPARTICRDDLLVEIARRNPTRERDLMSIRGLPRRDLKAIVDAADRARTLPLDQCPEVAEREQDSPQVQLMAGILSAVLVDFCSRRELASNLVATTSDVKQMVRLCSQSGAAGTTPESLLSQGWRREHVYPVLCDVLEGRQSIRIADPRAEAPLGYESWVEQAPES